MFFNQNKDQKTICGEYYQYYLPFGLETITLYPIILPLSYAKSEKRLSLFAWEGHKCYGLIQVK